MDKFIASFVYNHKFYTKHYLRLTFKSNFNIDGLLKPKQYIKIEIPNQDKLSTQAITTIKVDNRAEFFKHVEMLKPYNKNIIGYTLLGEPIEKEKIKLDDFIYYEKCETSDDIKVFKNNFNLLTYSKDQNKFINSYRLYDKNGQPSYEKVKICYYNAWIKNIEKQWIECKDRHYEILINK